MTKVSVGFASSHGGPGAATFGGGRLQRCSTRWPAVARARHSRRALSRLYMMCQEETRSEDEILQEAKDMVVSKGSDGQREVLSLARKLSPQKGLELLLFLFDNCESEIVEAAATVLLGQIGRKDKATTEKCVDELSRRLSSADYDYGVRSAAATGLGELRHPGSIEALRRAYYEDTEWAVQYAIITALGNLGDREVVPILVDALKSPVAMLVQSAISALGEIGDDRAVPHLLRLVGIDDMITEQSLAQALGRFTHCSEAIDALKQMAASDNPLVADAAEESLHGHAEALAQLSDEDAAAGPEDAETEKPFGALNVTLRDMLERSFNQKFSPKSEDGPLIADQAEEEEVNQLSDIRKAEYRELCKMLKDASADERAVAAIRLRSFSQRLKEAAVRHADALHDASQRVRASILNLIAHNPNTLASVLLGDSDQNVRASACSALVECGQIEAGVQATVTAFENDSDWIVRVSAAIALGTYAVNDRRAFNVLVRSLSLRAGLPFIPKMEPPEALVVQSHVITSLGFVGSREALPFFEEMLICKEWKIRQRIASAAGFIKDSRSLVLVGKLVDDEAEEVREAAEKSRERLLSAGF
mmetsp:Transcript_4849/g.14621  ORF Transcript_4849/g.14621 Transcript_4849/m.14621 type:complete len:591 (-) Transcript_4849:1322-3094(-)